MEVHFDVDARTFDIMFDVRASFNICKCLVVPEIKIVFHELRIYH